MRRNIVGGLAAALTLWATLAAAEPAAAGSAASSTAPEFAICKKSGSSVGWRCGRRAPRAADSFKGRDAAVAIRVLGAPERTRALSGGAAVLVWDRSGIALAEGGRVVRREECQLQMAIARSGIVADTLFTSGSESCAKRFGFGAR